MKRPDIDGLAKVLSETGVTSDRLDPRLNMKKTNGQNVRYLVLSDEELAKGYIRPYRDSYVHVGIRPQYELRDLTAEEQKDFAREKWIKFEIYPIELAIGSGRYWTEARLNSGCGVQTKMGQKLSETYAINPKFYGATFCAGCGTHFPVEEFVWDGTNERVGS